MRFNTKKPSSKTVNLAGGSAYKESAKLELACILSTTFLKDGFYRSADETANRIKELVSQLPDKKFAAQAALWARKLHGIRSASHLVAAEIGKHVKDVPWTKDFFNTIVHRPDDATEILACYMHSYGKPIPNSMKKGLGAAISRMDEYKLAKYRGQGNDISMIDAVNLLRPKGSDALAKLMKGELKNTETWEAKLSEAGQVEEGDVIEAKGEAWAKILMDDKLGYMALLKNLRNMLAELPDNHFFLLCQRLTDRERIKKSLVLPFRFITAYDIVKQSSSRHASAILAALAEATELSMDNVPRFDGRTCIMLDMSGSMTSTTTRNMPVFQVAALFTAIMAKNNNADIIMFDNNARYATINRVDSVYSISQDLKNQFGGGGTNLRSAFELLARSQSKYDRIVILSDMQIWLNEGKPVIEITDQRTGEITRPKIFSFDLAGLGTIQFPQNEVFCLAGWSDKSLAIMKALDQDQNAMIREIEDIII